MWAPLPPAPPPPGWWVHLETDRWVAGIEADLRAERIERLKALAHRVDMRAAGALARDRWARIQRRGDELCPFAWRLPGRVVGCRPRDHASRRRSGPGRLVTDGRCG